MLFRKKNCLNTKKSFIEGDKGLRESFVSSGNFEMFYVAAELNAIVGRGGNRSDTETDWEEPLDFSFGQ